MKAVVQGSGTSGTESSHVPPCEKVVLTIHPVLLRQVFP
ncbi:protein of unknown function [Nitrospira japonica]|uniref:Uncharacterized protein n=1 Tax=Nitrospira japonica TaxID=1325564 RepID=A0A1W1I0N1_9BACT|nr:protein of unknown function [Nitrospira japonica]